jgi:hypothetical protein
MERQMLERDSFRPANQNSTCLKLRTPSEEARTARKASSWLVLGLGAFFVGMVLMPLGGLSQTVVKPKPPCLLDSGDCDAVDGEAFKPRKKWHPGHYMQLMNGETDTDQNYRFARYDEIADNANIEGVSYAFRWSMLEGDTRGDYSAGFALLHAELDKLESLAIPKRLIIRMNTIAYGKTCPAKTHFPSYVINNGWLFETSSCIIKFWEAAPTEAYIDLLNAYAAEFDDEPYFEGIYLIRETAPGWQGRPVAPDFSPSAYISNMERIVAAAGAAFEKTNAVQSLNYLGTQNDVNEHMAYIFSRGVGHGAPDLLPEKCADRAPVQSDISYLGLSGGVEDWRGTLPSIRSIEVTQMGLNLGDCTPSQLYDYGNHTIKASHILWQRNTFAGTAAQQWPAILKFIQTNPVTNTACPKMYTQGCDSR